MPRQLRKSKSLQVTEGQLKLIFRKYDDNNDGLLSKKELKEAFRYLGAIIPGWRAGHAISYADENGDGFISEEEMGDLVKYALQYGYSVK